MLKLTLMSLGAYVFQALASPALPLPGLPPIRNPALPTLPASLPTAGIPTPVLLTSVPGVNNPATAFPSLPGASAPSLGGLPPLPSVPGGVPSAGLPSVAPPGGLPTAGLPTPGLPTPDLPTAGLPTPGLPTPGLPTSGLPSAPALPTLNNPALVSSISAALGGLPTGVPNPDLPLPPGVPNPGLPIPIPPKVPGGPKQPDILTLISSAIELLVFIYKLASETAKTGGIQVPGVAELGVNVGSSVIGLLLTILSGLLDKIGAAALVSAPVTAA